MTFKDKELGGKLERGAEARGPGVNEATQNIKKKAEKRRGNSKR